MGYLEEQARLKDLVTRYRWQRCSIGGVQFYMNPQRCEFPDSNLFVEVPTASGYGRFFYGQKPRKYLLEGTTATGGVPALKAMDSFRPIFGRTDAVYNFAFPWRFTRIRFVLLDSMMDYVQSDHPFSPYYQIQLTELPPSQPSYRKLAGTNAVGGAAGAGGAIVSTPTLFQNRG